MSSTATPLGLKSGTFGVGTFSVGRANAFPGLVLADGQVLDLTSHYRDTHEIFQDWDRSFEQLSKLAAKPDGPNYPFTSLQPHQPLAHPNLLCAGANYKQHAAEMLTKNKFNQHNRLPEETEEEFFKRNYALMEKRSREGIPFFWTGLHSSLTGANDDVMLPKVGTQHDWELELGVVIARSERYVSPQDAERLIAGYVIINDIGTVDEFRRKDVPWGFDWVSKHQPSFKVAGPFIVPTPFVNLDEIRIHLELNGKVMQDWPVTDMIFSIPQILSYASERVKMLPGDILITGSPPGNGAMHGRFLQHGDIIESTITGLGTQKNHCRTEVSPRAPDFWALSDVTISTARVNMARLAAYHSPHRPILPMLARRNEGAQRYNIAQYEVNRTYRTAQIVSFSQLI